MHPNTRTELSRKNPITHDSGTQSIGNRSPACVPSTQSRSNPRCALPGTCGSDASISNNQDSYTDHPSGDGKDPSHLRPARTPAAAKERCSTSFQGLKGAPDTSLPSVGIQNIGRRIMTAKLAQTTVYGSSNERQQ